MIRRRPLLLLLAVFSVVVAMTAIIACGSGGDDVDEVLSETFSEGQQPESGRIGLDLRVDARGVGNVSGPVGIRLSGPFATAGEGSLPRFDLSLALNAGGQTIQAGAVSTGDRGFVRFQGQPYVVDNQLFGQFRRGYLEQARCNEGRGGEGVSLQTLGIDPQRWLRDPTDAGTEEVAGTETTHIRADVDVSAFLDDVESVLARTDSSSPADPCASAQADRPQQGGSQQLTPRQRQRIQQTIRSARLEVFSGEEDRILRRMVVELGLAPAPGGNGGGSVRFDLTFGDVNEDQRITAPANALPLEQLTQRFGGQLPRLG